MIWRPPDREDRHVAALWAVCAVSALLLRPVWLAGARWAPPCPWHVLTGWPCPGCGSTRALVGLLHADVPSALAMNPLATCSALAFVTGGIVAPLWLALGGPAVRVASRPRPAWLVTLASVVLANWAWLCASGV